MFWEVGAKKADVTVTSNTSSSRGCGAFWAKAWFHFQWWDRLRPLCIAMKEMIPIVVAAAIFGKEWPGKNVEF